MVFNWPSGSLKIELAAVHPDERSWHLVYLLLSYLSYCSGYLNFDLTLLFFSILAVLLLFNPIMLLLCFDFDWIVLLASVSLLFSCFPSAAVSLQLNCTFLFLDSVIFYVQLILGWSFCLFFISCSFSWYKENMYSWWTGGVWPNYSNLLHEEVLGVDSFHVASNGIWIGGLQGTNP